MAAEIARAASTPSGAIAGSGAAAREPARPGGSGTVLVVPKKKQASPPLRTPKKPAGTAPVRAPPPPARLLKINGCLRDVAGIYNGQ